MIELIIMGVIALIIFGAIYYQNYRDKLRWKRIESGMSLNADRSEVPLLQLEGHTYNSHDRRVLVVWADLTQSTCNTVSDASAIIQREESMEKARANGARVFQWDGKEWLQRK